MAILPGWPQPSMTATPLSVDRDEASRAGTWDAERRESAVPAECWTSSPRRFDARFEFRRRRSSRSPAREPASWPARAVLLVAIAAFVVGARSSRRGR